MFYTVIIFYPSVCGVLLIIGFLFATPPTERLLRLDRGERRKEYRRQDFISLDKIPTWREENSCKSLLSAASPRAQLAPMKRSFLPIELNCDTSAAV